MLTLIFNFGRTLSNTEELTPAKFNAIVKGMTATLTGTVGTSDLDAGAVTPAKTTTGAYFYATATLAAGTYTAAYTPTISGYTDGLVLAFKAGSANAGAVNFDAGGGAKPLRKHAGIALVANDIAAGQIVEVRYNSTLVAGGCWEVTSLLGLAEGAGVIGATRNLIAANNSGSPNTQVDITADEAVLKNSSGAPMVHTSISLTANITTGGANGLDTGAEASSTWYYLWLISNATTVASLLSTSSTSPTLPSGYTYKCLIGAVRNDGSSNFVVFYQQDRQVWINDINLFTNKAAAVADTYESYQAGGGGGDVDLRTVVPPITKSISGTMGDSSSVTDELMAIAADANGLGACTSAGGRSGGNALNGFSLGMPFRVPLKTQQLFYWKSLNTGARNAVNISGYTI